MSNWNKEEVIERFEAKELIEQAIQKYKPNIYIAFSGGKASLVVLHMALKVWKDIPVMFCNTGVEFPETIEFVHKLKKLWDLNLVETHPYKKNFWKCVEDYGLPSYKSDTKKPRPKCCYYLKHKPAELKSRERGFKACFTGIQSSESYGRRRLIRFCGQRYIVKRTGMAQYHPIAFWNDKEVWSYIRENKLPYNSAYDKYKNCDRTGCMPCTSYRNWKKKLGIQNPQMLRVLLRIECPEQTELKNEIEK